MPSNPMSQTRTYLDGGGTIVNTSNFYAIEPSVSTPCVTSILLSLLKHPSPPNTTTLR